MLINDCHVHATGKETASSIEKALDANNIDKIILISPHPYLLKYTWKTMSLTEFKESIKFVSKIQKELDGRIYGFAFIDPRMIHETTEVVKYVEWALTAMELYGIKMIPAGWYPYEEKMYLIYKKIEDLNAPILFHCGISWGFPDSSRYCRPVFYEALIRFPRLRFALAHMCWPWIDEALAVAGRFTYPLLEGFWDNYPLNRPQIILDIAAGAPLLWKVDALNKALKYLGAQLLMYGSDCIGANDTECYRESIERDLTILRDKLRCKQNDLNQIFYKNFEWFIKG